VASVNEAASRLARRIKALRSMRADSAWRVSWQICGWPG
jgi:hypothetical protein